MCYLENVPLTAKPTDAPTESPSSNPTPIPTAIPTPIPETEDPTLLPTLDFTTISPTRQASLKPSVTVTQFISEIPTQFPTASPTLTAPTLLAIVAPPTDAPILSFKYKKTTLRVRDVTLMHFRSSRRVLQSNLNYELDANCTLTWQVLVQDRIKNELVAAIQEYEALNVELRDISSSSPSNKTAWSLTFDVFMEIRAANIEYLDPIRITVGAFDSKSDKLSYIEYLKATHCDEFDDVHSVSLHVPISREEETPSKSSSQLAAIYASISVGLAAIVMTAITICCYLHFRNKRRVNDLASADNLQLIQPTSKSNTRYSRYVGTPSIVGGKSKNSDVSTLGDPIPFGIIREQNDDLSSANESCSIEYDFKKAFLDLHSVTDSQMCGTVDDQVSATGMTLNDDDVATTDLLLPQNLKLMIALADDIVTTAGDGTLNLSQDETLSVEHEYEVIVPPGMLGLILESHTGNGRPMVNSIKPNTVLYSVVHIGDYIDAVDGVNVKMMSANDVSRLIVKKQEEVRILEFARSMKRKTYHL